MKEERGESGKDCAAVKTGGEGEAIERHPGKEKHSHQRARV
jgi:hypothetical protein